MSFRLFGLLLLACATAPKGASHAPEASAARDLACSLADEVGPRLAGSPGDARAVVWALDKMKALGLSNVHAEPVTVPHWERGEASAELLSPFPHALRLAALGGSVATPEQGLEAEVISVPDLETLRALPDAAVQGRIVFVDKIMERASSGEGYGKTVAIRWEGAADAAKKGAVACIIRSVGTGNSRFAHTGGLEYRKGVPPVPGAALAIPDAELLRRTFARGQPVRMRLRLTPRRLPDAPSANVVGEVTGTSLPQEVVLLGAHLDSWDLGDGALDDGSGVGLVLDVARRISTSPLKRTVRVVLFANEEYGSEGALGYAKAHREELARHLAAIEADSGDGAPTGVIYQGGPTAPAAMAALGPKLERWGLPAPQVGDAGGADTRELPGVPQVEVVQNRSRYFDVHHTEDDTCEKLDGEGMAHTAQVLLELTRHLAELTVDLGRLSPDAPHP